MRTSRPSAKPGRSRLSASHPRSAPEPCRATQAGPPPIYTTNSLWYVKRTVPNWRFCADGAAIEGFQEYKIYPVGSDGHYDGSAKEYTGVNRVIGPSGSCGRNQWPVIEMPFYMKPA